MDYFPLAWKDLNKDICDIVFQCGYCGATVAPSWGWSANPTSGTDGFILICPLCNNPTFIHRLFKNIIRIVPSPKLGNSVAGLPGNVEDLYNEARNCTGVGAYTAAVLICRKLLMHIAVEKGANEGQNFVSYVEFFEQGGYIPPDGKGWVDYIRTKSNEANHEIVCMTKDDAENLITFTEMLLRLVFEFKTRLPLPKP